MVKEGGGGRHLLTNKILIKYTCKYNEKKRTCLDIKISYDVVVSETTWLTVEKECTMSGSKRMEKLAR